MKTNKFLTFLSVLTLTLFITSCVEDDDYETPNVTIPEVDISELGDKTTFAAVIARYQTAVADGDDVGIFDTENDQPLYVEGYVVSSDASGNFYEEIIIQNSTDGNDAAGDARTGFNVQINVRGLSDTYEVGRKVYVRLNGLAIGEENGVYTLGRANGSSLEQLQEYEYLNFIIRSSEVAMITPKVLSIDELTPSDENTLVQFSDMQFVRNELTLTYAGEATDEFDGFRTIENCESGATMTLQTSTFADFKSLQVAQQKGTITGIYSRDFGDDFSVLVLNGSVDVNFANADRCDPVILECEGTTSTAMTVWEEDFESISDESDLDGIWFNGNVSGGSERYELNSFSGDQYLKISAFGTGENPLEAWLVTPAINLDGSDEEELSFNVSSNFETGRILTAFITEDYTGDPLTTEWIELDANIPIGDGGFGDFVESTLNISCLNGDVHVAFKYLGADGGAETRYHITDVKVTGSM
ncbi:DUF5689 domain-containing protein [Oceanihabitans sp.]|nr:DUF5689 domain-containing protein [Oceanihabitans sp.]